MRVLFVASECVPFVKTGGLADVAGALPKALSKLGIDVRVLMPAYSSIRALIKAKKGMPVTVLTGTQAVIYTAEAEGLSLMLVDAPDLYDRPGNPYLAGNGRDWPDNHRRFGALARAAAAVANGKAGNWRPDIVHMHDWQAGLVPLYLREDAAKPASVFTIHNIAFQGLFESSVIGELGLPAQGFTFEGYEYFGKVSFLKAGLVHADAITTVSPTYAKELTSSEFGMGMEGLLASRQSDMTGILNGIDTEIWNPDKDFQIACTYNARSLARKARNKRVVEERFGIEPGKGPLFCVVSRLTLQKGLDLLIDNLPLLFDRGGRLVVLGSGDAELERRFLESTRAYSGRLGVIIGYDEPLSHLMQAGSDAILIPSRFEPCGLTQLYGLRYGTLPVVARTGGLADTVIDANYSALANKFATGFMFQPGSATALGDALERTIEVYSQKKLWQTLMRLAMRQEVGWDVSAGRYQELYQSLVAD